MAVAPNVEQFDHDSTLFQSTDVHKCTRFIFSAQILFILAYHRSRKFITLVINSCVFSLLVWCLITVPVHGVNFPCEWLILVSFIAMSCQAPWQVWLVSGGSSRMMLIYFAALIRCFRCYRRTFFSPAQGKFKKNKKLTMFFFIPDWRRNQRLFGFLKIRVRKVWFFFQTLPVHEARQIHGQTGTLEQCWGGKAAQKNAVWLITGPLTRQKNWI